MPLSPQQAKAMAAKPRSPTSTPVTSNSVSDYVESTSHCQRYPASKLEAMLHAIADNELGVARYNKQITEDTHCSSTQAALSDLEAALSRLVKQRQSTTSSSSRLSREDTDRTEGSRLSGPSRTLSSLPAEILLSILCYSSNYRDLENTILAHPALYGVFFENKKIVLKAVSINDRRDKFRSCFVPYEYIGSKTSASEMWTRMWSNLIEKTVTDGFISLEWATTRFNSPVLSRPEYDALVTWRDQMRGITCHFEDLCAISISRTMSQGWADWRAPVH